MDKRANLLLITIDSLRADHLGCLGYARSLSPHIDQLASEGTLFTQAIANGPRSPASFPSILASVYLSAGAGQGIPREATTLAEVLQQHGYATAGFCAGNVYISKYYGYQRGFDLFHDFIALGTDAHPPRRERADKLLPLKRRVRRIWAKNGRYDLAILLFSGVLRGRKNVADSAKSADEFPFEAGETLNEQAMAWLSHSSDKPFFLWLHYMDVHYPYLPRTSRHRLSDYGRSALALICLLSKHYSYPRQTMLDLYDGRIRDMDRILAQLVDRLKEYGLYKDTVIALTADHGDEFREHGDWGHGAKLYDELLRVPLIVKGPGLARAATVTGQIGLIDLAPTILDLLGLEKVESFQGASFLPWLGHNQDTVTNPYVFSEAVHVGGRWPPLWGQDSAGKKLYRIRSCRSEEWKYIWDEEGNKEELYKLRADPGETKNIADSEPETVRQFALIMREHFSAIDSFEPAAVGASEGDLSPEEEGEIARRLHRLGYF
ncbi:MAG: sulfatase [Anaerolineae bacterium]|nr:sulfatase [Anaerolineae bacterium]